LIKYNLFTQKLPLIESEDVLLSESLGFLTELKVFAESLVTRYLFLVSSIEQYLEVLLLHVVIVLPLRCFKNTEWFIKPGWFSCRLALLGFLPIFVRLLLFPPIFKYRVSFLIGFGSLEILDLNGLLDSEELHIVLSHSTFLNVFFFI